MVQNSCFFSVEKVNNIFIPNYLWNHHKLSWYHPKLMYENIILKDMNKFKFSKSTAFYGFFADQFKINYTLKSNCRKRFEFFRNLFVQSQNWQHILLDFREEEKRVEISTETKAIIFAYAIININLKYVLENQWLDPNFVCSTFENLTFSQ